MEKKSENTLYRIVSVPKNCIENKCLFSSDLIQAHKICFGPAASFEIPNSNLKYRKVPMYYEHEPGKFSNFFIELPRSSFSFGVQKQRAMTKDVSASSSDSYVMPICVYDVKEPTAEQQNFVKNFDMIEAACRAHLLSERVQVDLDMEIVASQLEKLANCMYYKMKPNDGNSLKNRRVRDPEKGPIFYAKLKCYRDPVTGIMRMDTRFRDANDVDTTADAIAMYTEYATVSAICILEGIYIGDNYMYRLQARLHEARVTPINRRVETFLRSEVALSSDEMEARAAAHDELDMAE
jgi:hypothetical protein